ncbi:MAG: transpeptidase family protein [Sporocytophaga sp.]|uniref:penicillin-binding protein n=1 Tax=Sporocytophaga sp. TaxID=2231183 RepID=UPI001B005C63|nr:penicillin-binding protein [Sporocytophaga sp.]MBO9700242.1 transpeptidase family protein [Sporocytophaga sp.]
MNIKRSIVLRVRVAFLVILLFSFAIIGKILYIQFVDGDKWRKLAVENLVQFRKVKATRGNIYSDNGSLLATSLPFYKVAIDPRIADDKVFKDGIDSLSRFLSAFFKDKSSLEYKRKIQDARAKRKQYLVINRKMINFQAKKEMATWPIFREGRSKGGVIFEKVDKRFRPFSYLAMRTVGFINEDNKGAGLEYSFHRDLGGTDGEALFMKIAGGEWKPMHDESEVRPKQGIDIQTTININMQDVAESSLLRHLTAHDADYGCVVLMEVATGEIKAIANLGKQAPGVYAENYNYAVGNQGLTDPGSTFKLASVIALFEDSNIELEDSVETGTGTYEFYDRLMTDSKPEGYGTITFQEAFEKSSNIGISRKVNEHFGLNPQKYIDYIHSLGLADPIGFQMHGEAKPFIKKPTDRTWSGISLPWMSIGYELKISPLQTLMLYNAVANNGKMIKPIIVKETKLADKTLQAYETEVVREKICSDNTLAKVKKMLEGVVERGTANNINNTIYKIAGKTGTAQKIKNGQYIRDYYCSFAGYFPADKPKYSCIVVIDSPKGYKKYGSDVAAPVFKEVADKIYATDLDLHQPIARTKVSPEIGVFPVIKGGYHEDLNYLCNELGISNHSFKEADEWVMAKAVNNAVMWQQKELVQGAVPDGTGLTLRDAYYVFENAGLRVRHVGHGRVSRQSMPPGARIVKGSTIYIELE